MSTPEWPIEMEQPIERSNVGKCFPQMAVLQHRSGGTGAPPTVAAVARNVPDGEAGGDLAEGDEAAGHGLVVEKRLNSVHPGSRQRPRIVGYFVGY
jgi:hypothetical protein